MYSRVAVLFMLLIALSLAGCGSPSEPEQGAENPEELVEKAMESRSVRILEQQLARIPKGTPGRERVVSRLEELRSRAAEEDAAKREQRKKAAAEKRRQSAAAAAEAERARQEVLASLKSDTDEFQKATFYKHPKTPILGTQVYLYIAASEDNFTLRLVATYEGSDWIFWDTLLVKSGEDVVSLNSGRGDVDREHSSGTVWETLDVPVAGAPIGASELTFSETAAPAFSTLMTASAATIRFQGKTIHDHKLPPAELARFQEVGKKFMSLFGIRD